MDKVHFDEAKQSQLPFVELLLNMGYVYISTDEALRQRGSASDFILKDIAREQLMKINQYEVGGELMRFSEKEIFDTIESLEHEQYSGLIDTAQKIYNTIMPTSGGKTVQVHYNGKKFSKNFKFIDFEHPENNVFHVTTEFTVDGKQTIRPDIVCFVNGIPLAIIENKKSSISIQEAITQMNRNQTSEYCPAFYTFTQLLVATNGKELQYGTTGTPSKFYAVWKEKETPEEVFATKVQTLIQKKIDTTTYKAVLSDLNGYTEGYVQKTERLITEQDKGVVSLFEPARFLDLVKNYILFDGGVKKLSRYQQYFAIHKMIDRIGEFEEKEGTTRRRGGLVWHTQGSGKSLTMVMFVKALIENPQIENPRVIIVTDRVDLDKQIKTTFENCNLKKEVIRARSGQHLVDMIKDKELGVITTLVHKFESARKSSANFIDQDKNIFVLIDEAHRSQGGMANLEMNRLIPNACFIGFTGTPLMSEEKASWKKFGDYIDRYTIDDALEDKIILPLIYEGRYVELTSNDEQIDRRVDRVIGDLGKDDKNKLQRFIDADIAINNPRRIEEIGVDIVDHYVTTFKGTGLKAQVVAPSKYAAVLFKRYFDNEGNLDSAIIISDEKDDMDPGEFHKKEVLAFLKEIKDQFGSTEKYEKAKVDSFKYNDDGVEVLIVVDKLLTGFDAPRNTVLYLAKSLKDHNLLQAIARVNRLYDNKVLQKTAGYVLDYSENAKNIDTALKLFGSYDEEDVRHALIDVQDKIGELEDNYSKLNDLFKSVQGSNDDERYLQLLKDEPTRKEFYKNLNDFTKTFNECFVLKDFVNEFKLIDTYRRDLKKYISLRKTSDLVYADGVDLTEYKRSIVQILDQYIDVKEVEFLTKQVNINNREEFEEVVDSLGSDASKAEAIAHQTNKVISDKMDSDPEFYRKFSERVNEILRKLKEKKMADIEALKQMKLIYGDVLDKKDADTPESIKGNPGADILYRNVKELLKTAGIAKDGEIIEIVLELLSVIKKESVVDWHKNSSAKKIMMNALDDYIYDVLIVEKGLEIDSELSKKLIGQVVDLAEYNHSVFA